LSGPFIIPPFSIAGRVMNKLVNKQLLWNRDSQQDGLRRETDFSQMGGSMSVKCCKFWSMHYFGLIRPFNTIWFGKLAGSFWYSI